MDSFGLYEHKEKVECEVWMKKHPVLRFIYGMGFTYTHGCIPYETGSCCLIAGLLVYIFVFMVAKHMSKEILIYNSLIGDIIVSALYIAYMIKLKMLPCMKNKKTFQHFLPIFVVLIIPITYSCNSLVKDIGYSIEFYKFSQKYKGTYLPEAIHNAFWDLKKEQLKEQKEQNKVTKKEREKKLIEDTKKIKELESKDL